MDQISGIIDAHAHSDKKFSWEHTSQQLVEMMNECNIVQSVLAPYWDLPTDADSEAVDRFLLTLKSYPGKFLGFLRLNPNSAGAKILLEDLAEK
ncbi:MAG: hypothetical protein ACHQ03_11625, partial [Candidatus Bathyarchaeia archaeon]